MAFSCDVVQVCRHQCETQLFSQVAQHLVVLQAGRFPKPLENVCYGQAGTGCKSVCRGGDCGTPMEENLLVPVLSASCALLSSQNLASCCTGPLELGHTRVCELGRRLLDYKCKFYTEFLLGL